MSIEQKEHFIVKSYVPKGKLDSTKSISFDRIKNSNYPDNLTRNFNVSIEFFK